MSFPPQTSSQDIVIQKAKTILPERPRVLIVDDDAQARRAVLDALRREAAQIDGIEADVLEADTIAQAREALQREEFACVFLDHSLPDGTSLDLLMELRAQGRATPVVVLTGGRDVEAILEVMRAGAADYLPKERLHPDLVARSLRASLRFLQAQREKQAVLDELRARDRAIAAASNGIVIADPRRPDCPLVYTNGAFLSMTGYAEEEVIGRNCRFLQGADTDPAAVQELREAVRRERPCQVLILNHRKDGSTFWNEVTVTPVRDTRGALTHFVGVQTDVTARQAANAERGRVEAALRRRARRERFLAELAERARGLTDPDAVIADAVRSVGEFLGVSRCLFADIDIEADTCSIPPHYRADASVASIAGVIPISAFGPFVVAEYEAGHTAVVDDVRADPAKAPPESLAAYEAIGVRAYVAAPVLHSARLVSAIAVHSALPRHWEPEEVELLQRVVERTWLTVEVTRQQRALAREAEEQRVRAEREALLNRIGQALRGSPDPETVLETAVQELGRALGADRCYYAAYDQDADTARVGPEWHREGLPDVAGQYPMSRFAVNRDPAYRAGRTQVVADTTGDAATQVLGLRALVRVPLVSGASMTALSAAMTGGPRAWEPDEVSLVEAVATQTQSALEAVRVRRREHAIAQQLQDALQPALPERVLGLSVGRFTKPALDEAQIGGDFYDIFPLDKELFAVVIGDVSGKGLAAAQQLALVRNSLRTTLYLYRSPAQAATALNRILTSHDLLVGFVTAWVGVYDALTGRIAYCSCGHEPGLARRGDGTVEETETTGPPLGVAENAEYGEEAVSLSSGDALLLYTDGLSESGPSRRELLGTDGLTRILKALPVDPDVQAEAERLVAEVGEATGGVFRDDVAILLLRRE